jgi:hypothetical protein
MQGDEIFVLVLVVLFVSAIAAAALDSRRRSGQVTVDSPELASEAAQESDPEAPVATGAGEDAGSRPASRPHQSRRR